MSLPAMILAGVVFVPYFWAGGFYTVPEYFGRRYNEGVRAITTIIWGLFIAGNIAVIFAASTEVLATMLELEDYAIWVLIASAAFVGVYTYCGGLAAVTALRGQSAEASGAASMPALLEARWVAGGGGIDQN